ncbi:hypothetical protein BC833DRAFT_328203 [Globomyces pollinis-pini]|nr:hypothetical protein BC833DRAFT_328203 [Globomyces pollinis-pini]
MIHLISLFLIFVKATIKDCPVAGICPFYHNYNIDPNSFDQKPCPLKTGNCPYYLKHQNDKDYVNLFKSTDHCPLKGKCSFYTDIKNGIKKDYDWGKSECPLAKGCPYYSKAKSDPSKLTHCPLLKTCPHFQKDIKHDMDGDASECPFLASAHIKALHAHISTPNRKIVQFLTALIILLMMRRKILSHWTGILKNAHWPESASTLTK